MSVSTKSAVKQNQKGFTLIELMVVVGIVAILAAVAYPSYQEQIRRGQRTDAQAMLLRLASEQEKFYSANFRYAASFNELGVGATVASEDDHYNAALATAVGGQTYTLTATRAGAPDPNCGNLGLTSAGTKTETGSRDVAYCW